MPHSARVHETGIYKDYPAPPFCGALIVPKAVARRTKEVDPLPAEFGAYTSQSNWPAEWARLCAELPDNQNFGTHLRWNAAICEIRRFDAIDAALRDRIISELGAIISSTHDRCEWIRPLAAQSFERADDPADSRWQDCKTIFAFELLRDSGNGRMTPLTIDAAKTLHRRLGEDLTGIVPAVGEGREILAMPCFLGQPIKAARQGDGWTGALRIAIGAPMVSTIAEELERVASFEAGLREITRKLECVHRKMELILQSSELAPSKTA